MQKAFGITLTLFFAVLFMIIGASFGVALMWESSLTEELKIEEVEEEEVASSAIEWEEAIVATVENISPAVVSIVASKDVSIIYPPFYYEEKTERREIGGGTGFLISKNGLVLTNRHVVRDEEANYVVFTNDGREFEAEVLARDPIQDLAVLKIEGEDFPTVELGNSSDIRIGQTAIAIGNALGEFRNTVSVGVISGLGRRVFATDGRSVEVLENVIQTDAGINRGNSGGPLLNIHGEVIGINTAMAIDAQNIGFAIPIDSAKRAITGVIEEGRIVYPFLGVRYIMINEEVQKQRGLPVSYGALLLKGDRGEPAVDEGSAAEKAGLKKGDIILEMDGVRLDEENPLVFLIMDYYPGEEVSLKVLRGEDEVFFNAVLGERVY